jgi:hypothetical protein
MLVNFFTETTELRAQNFDGLRIWRALAQCINFNGFACDMKIKSKKKIIGGRGELNTRAENFLPQSQPLRARVVFFLFAL